MDQRAEREDRPRIIVVGGGFGGLKAARALKRSRAEVVLVDRQNHHLFQPLLYQVATAVLSPGNIASPIRSILKRQQNCQVLMAEVTDVDLDVRTVQLDHRESYAYDYLVLAAGMRTHYFGNDAWAARAPGLKRLEEATDIRSHFLAAFEQAEMETDAEARRAALTFVLVGAGPTGVELAGAMAEIARGMLRRDFRRIRAKNARVILLDAEDRVLCGFPAELSARAQRDLEAMGVEVRLGCRVTEVDDQGVTIQVGDAEERLESLTVVWAAGVRAARIADRLPVEKDEAGRILVQTDLSIPGHPEAFVIGDLAHLVDPKTGEAIPGVAPAALQEGAYVGRLIRARIGGRPGPSRPFAYRDKGMLATIGRNRAVAALGSLRFSGYPAFVLWALVHVMSLVEFRNRLLTLGQWIWLYLFWSPGVRLINSRSSMPRPVRPPPDPRLAARSGTRRRP